MLRHTLLACRANTSHFLRILLSSSQRKHAYRWLSSLRHNYVLDTPMPWLTFDAVEFIQPRLRKGIRVFEYGSGGSTLFWLRQGGTCISIEHDPNWYAILHRRLASEQAIDYRLILPEIATEDGWKDDPADPDSNVSSDAAFRGYSFRKYVEQIDAYPNEFFDVVLIDGRARPACIKHSVSKVKVGGMLIVDNSDREYYFSQTRSYLGQFEERVFSGAIPLTAIMSSTTVFSLQRSNP